MNRETSREERYQSPVKAMMTGIGDLFRKPKGQVELLDSHRLDGKKVLITGASSGLGFSTAVEMARRGARVIMAVRSGIPGKGEEVKRLSRSDQVDMIHLDLSDLKGLPGFVKEVKKRFGTLDLFVSNAAMVASQGRETGYGLDEMFTVNYFAKFILVNLLLEEGLLASSGNSKPRVIFVASESHRNADHFDWEGFGHFHPYGIRESVAMYGYYKLLMVTMASELSRRLSARPSGTGSPISVFALCPGPVNSNIAREAPKVFQPLLRLVFTIFFRSPGVACRPVVYLAASPSLEGRTGEYMFLMESREMDPKATDPENGKRLWELSEQLMEKISSLHHKSGISSSR